MAVIVVLAVIISSVVVMINAAMGQNPWNGKHQTSWQMDLHAPPH